MLFCSDPQLAALYWASRSNGRPRLVHLYKLAWIENACAFCFGAGLSRQSSLRPFGPGRGARRRCRRTRLAGSWARSQKTRRICRALDHKGPGLVAAYYDALASAPREQQQPTSRRGNGLERCFEALKQRYFVQCGAPGVSACPLPRPLGEPFVPRRGWPAARAGRSGCLEGHSPQQERFEIAHEWGGRAADWKTSDQLVEAMFALSREYAPDGPLALYSS